VESTIGNKVSKFSGKAVLVEGRAAHITLTTAKTLGVTAAGEVETIRITTIGREGPTRSETARADIVRRALQRAPGCTLLEQPFFQALWLAGTGDESWPKWPKVKGKEADVGLYFPQTKLNGSQRAAARAILSSSDEDRVVLVQGPPGTGELSLADRAWTGSDAAQAKRRSSRRR
jgi:regulator of nonsense transcripts 1